MVFSIARAICLASEAFASDVPPLGFTVTGAWIVTVSGGHSRRACSLMPAAVPGTLRLC